MAAGSIGVLNVGAGDTKLVFDKNNPGEVIRSARIVKDMLRRGYALLIEVDVGKGKKAFQRVKEFREDTCEYIIADFDPIEAATVDAQEHAEKQEVEGSTESAAGEAAGARLPPAKRGGKTRAVPATGTRGVAVARSAGG